MTNSDDQTRFSSERQFHDDKYSKKGASPRHYQVSPTYHIFSEFKKMLGDLSGKRVLEIGCGTGWITYELALAGAEVVACDISEVAVARTEKLLERKGLGGKCTALVGPVESLDLPEKSFDFVLGFAILHHLDLETALPRVHRLLRAEGALVAAEPLATNPMIGLYRYLTPQFRTPDEHPLDLDQFCTDFSGQWEIAHREYYLSALFPLGLSYLPGGKAVFNATSPTFHSLDQWILDRWPRLGRLAWYSIFKMLPRNSFA